MYKVLHYTSLRAATSMAAASANGLRTATCGLVLLAQVPTRTTCVTVVAVSTQPTAMTVLSDFQSAVSPIFSGSSDFGYLLVEQGITSSFGVGNQNTGWSSNGYSNIQKTPLYIIRSGYFVSSDVPDGSFLNQASYGYLWSGTTRSGTGANALNYYSSNVNPASNNGRQLGFPVRCIARHFSYHIQKEKSGHMPVFLFML